MCICIQPTFTTTFLTLQNKWAKLTSTDAKCHLSFHMDGDLINELHRHFHNTWQNLTAVNMCLLWTSHPLGWIMNKSEITGETPAACADSVCQHRHCLNTTSHKNKLNGKCFYKMFCSCLIFGWKWAVFSVHTPKKNPKNSDSVFRNCRNI